MEKMERERLLEASLKQDQDYMKAQAVKKKVDV